VSWPCEIWPAVSIVGWNISGKSKKRKRGNL
jgi:hypothetical protein